MVNSAFLNRLRVFSIIALTTILLTCKPDRVNPWDILANISPDEWSPKNLSIENVNILEKRISWDYSGDNRIEGFKLDRKVGNDNWEVAHQTFDKSTKSWNDSDITPDSTITYSYRLYSFAGENKSAEVTITSKPVFPAPTNLKLEKINDKEYKLTWNDNSLGEQGFKIDRRTDNGDWIIAHGIVNANQTAYIDTNVFIAKSSINVEYRVYAYYQANETKKILANTNAALTPPNNLEITQNSIYSVTLNWNDNSTGEEGFKVERKYGEGEWQQIAQIKETTFDDNEFELNTTVYYRISAYIEDYNSAYAEANFDATIPPPSNAQVQQQTNLQYKLTWSDNSSGEQGFKIDRRTGEGEWQLAYGNVDANQTSYTDPNVYLSKSLDVEYRVYAFYEAYNSEKLLVSTQATIDAPTNLAINATSNTSVTLSWDYAQTEHQGFKVDRKAGDNDWQDAFATITKTQTTYTDNSVNISQNSYTYRVYAYYNQYNSEKEDAYIALPSIVTTEATSITATTATTGGNISNEGSTAVTSCGVVWSTSQLPTITNNEGSTSNGTGTGSFVSELTGLKYKTTYYTRAYATNSAGTQYGNQIIFTTLATVPQVSTTEVSDITSTTAISGGDVSSDGGSVVTARGIVWGATSNPTLENNLGFTNSGNGTGIFVSELINLIASTTYFVKAYATNEAGTSYGDEVSFSTITPWSQKADFGGIGRVDAAGFSINGKGYIGTGRSSAGNLNDFWEYDPLTNTWTQIAHFGGGPRYGAVGFTIEGKGYLGTGYIHNTWMKDFWEYDPTNNLWERKADFGGSPRYGAVSFAIGEKGYIGTGGVGSSVSSKDFWEYDPVLNLWTRKMDLNGSERVEAVGFSLLGKGYIGTGITGYNTSSKDFWEYDPVSNTWTQRADFGGAARSGAVGFSMNGKGYIGSTTDFWEFDPSLNTWTRKTDFPGTSSSFGFTINGKGYIGAGNLNDFWEYNPELD